MYSAGRPSFFSPRDREICVDLLLVGGSDYLAGQAGVDSTDASLAILTRELEAKYLYARIDKAIQITLRTAIEINLDIDDESDLNNGLAVNLVDEVAVSIKDASDLNSDGIVEHLAEELATKIKDESELNILNKIAMILE